MATAVAIVAQGIGVGIGFVFPTLFVSASDEPNAAEIYRG